MIPIQQADPLQDKFNEGVQTFYDLLKQGKWILRCATSFGKDSSTFLAMVLKAGALASRDGIDYPPIIVSHSDTSIENPKVQMQVKHELKNMREYCAKNNVKYQFSLARPEGMENYLVRIIGGNRLPTYANGPAQCSVELKVVVQNRQTKQITNFIKKSHPSANQLLVTGVRKDESPARAKRIEERGDRADVPTQDADGNWIISPIMDWDTEEIFVFIATAKKFDVYSDMTRVFELYAEASGGGCAVVGDIVTEGEKNKRGSSCGSRFGCFACTRTGDKDKSMQNMLELPDNAFMVELNAFRNHLVAIRYDETKRRYLGRTIREDGTVGVIADVFNGPTLETLFKMIVSAQKKEWDEAEKLGIAPRFNYVNLEFVALIDAQWSRYGYFPPFHAWVLYKEIVEQNKLYLPSENVLPITPKPKGLTKHYGYVKVSEPVSTFSSFRNVMGEAVADDSCPPLSPMQIGKRTMSQMDIGDTYRFDKEGLMMFLEFELDQMIEQYHNPSVNPTFGIKTYLQYGCLTASSKGVASSDDIVSNTDRFYYSGLLAMDNEALKFAATANRHETENEGALQAVNEPVLERETTFEQATLLIHQEPEQLALF